MLLLVLMISHTDTHNLSKVKRTSQRMIRQSRVVGHLYKLESSTSRDIWELREPETGKTNALLKMRKWNGFVTGCVHITRGSKGVVSKGDIRIRRVRGRQSDVVITALLNNQLITTVKPGASKVYPVFYSCGVILNSSA